MNEQTKNDKRRVEANLTITKVQVIEDNIKKGVCKQIRFQTTDDGEVTFKPKDEVSKTRVNPRGLEIKSIERENMLIDDLPEILDKINSRVSANGSCTILCNITEWDTVDANGKPTTFKFFGSMKDFKAIKIVD